ncbi:restriction endonuclease subunit S [Cryobacterium sp. TMT2-10]|uniref:restriction endonuclease subunit S n=1 Tax=Cryobacterium sp. TMT2-10 TaxID=1259244 RepID=UPI00106AFEDE|nr:restriction endonuclease subunit S [Cryobacterium sp. TMT2-10]TFD35806.1 restriction endonuclease subunit S [Cryobacterium sp. TMT2-10]
MSEWTTLPLVEVMEFREGPGVLAKDFHDRGVPLIRLAGLKVGAGLLQGCNFLDPELASTRWSQFRLALGDVLLSSSASLGEVATVDPSAVGAIPYTGIIGFRARDERLCQRFIPFVLTAPTFKQQIQEMGVGSVMRHFGPSHLRQMNVSIPPRRDQEGIASVLGALDAKLAANAKLVEGAESLSQTLFKSIAGASTLVPLSEMARFVNGKAFTKGASGTGKVVIRIAELNSGISGSTVFSDAEVGDEFLARSGDILFAWSGSLTLHRWFRGDGIVNQHIFKVMPNEQPSWLIYELLRERLAYFKGIAADKATTMGHIQRRHLDELVAVPSRSAIDQIDDLMTALWQSALLAERESESLAATRDALLPQLMSGKLRVRDAEKVLEGVL